MTRDDVHALAGEILPSILGPVGFASHHVVERENSVGEDSFYVTVHMTPEAGFVKSPAFGDALVAMQDALFERGERRFAYPKCDFPSDPPPSAGDQDDEEDRSRTAKLRNPLMRDLLDLADGLARRGGRPSFRQAALRRSVGTACYAVFHALHTVCSDGLVRWSRTDLVDRTNRALDHRTARRRRPHALFSRVEVLLLIADARGAIDLLSAMDEDARRRLAVELLVAKGR